MQCNPYKATAYADRSAWRNENRVTFSALDKMQVEKYDAPTYSIKYVMRGTEHYHIHQRRFAVGAGQFLLVNKDQPLDGFIRSQRKVLGFCIHLKASLLNEVYAHMQQPEWSLLDHPFQQVACTDFEQLVYTDQENNLGHYLQYMWQQFDPQEMALSLDRDEVFYQLTHRLIGLQHTIRKEGHQLTVQKSTTQKELLRRLHLAKELIEAHPTCTLDMETVAREAALSGSHLFRSFKKVYGVSPYQFHLKKRLSYAAQLLGTRSALVTDVAFECGFPDLPSFSKAFKKVYQQSPNQFQKENSGALFGSAG